MSKVIAANFGGSPYREIAELHEAIMAVVHEYDDRIPLLSAIGALRLAEHALLMEAFGDVR